MNQPREYEMDGLSFYMDVVIPALPIVGLIAIVIGLIDLTTDIQWVKTQGKIRITSAVTSHILYAVAIALT